MLAPIIKWLDRASLAPVVAFGASLLAIVATLDYLTGYELSVSLFYLIPLIAVAMHASRPVGYLFCVVCAATWAIVDYLAGHVYSNGLFFVWNTVIVLGYFAVTTYLVTELKGHVEHEHALAVTDELTGVLNRRAFRDACHNVISVAGRYHHPVALGYVDVDSFKSVNDTLGHAEGDRVLRTTAQVISHHVRATDIVGRIGGDEFGIILPETDRGGSQIMFDRIHGALMAEAAKARWPIGYSIGVAVFHHIPEAVDDALRAADELMYRVKKTGKNDVIYREY